MNRAARNSRAVHERERLVAARALPRALGELLTLPTFTGFVTTTPVPGTTFEMLLCDRDDGIALRCFWHGVYEPSSSALIAALGHDADRIVDIGAHTGYFTLLAAHVAPRAQIIAVEPDAANLARLALNARANGCSNIAVVRAAAADVNGRGQLCNDAPEGYLSSGGRLTDDDGSATGQLVPTLVLDGFLTKERRPTALIKCDTEGSEQAALMGCAQTLRRDRPHLVIECNRPAPWRDIETLLRALGYRFWQIDETAPRLTEVGGLATAASAGETPERFRNRLASPMPFATLAARLPTFEFIPLE